MTKGPGHNPSGESKGGSNSNGKNGKKSDSKKMDTSKEKELGGAAEKQEASADSRLASLPSGSLQSSVLAQPELQDTPMDSGEVQPELQDIPMDSGEAQLERQDVPMDSEEAIQKSNIPTEERTVDSSLSELLSTQPSLSLSLEAEAYPVAPEAVRSDVSLSEEAILGVEDTEQEPTESLEELEDQSDENYFEQLRNNFGLREATDHPDEESESLGTRVVEESDSDYEENPGDSDTNSQLSQEEPAGSR